MANLLQRLPLFFLSAIPAILTVLCMVLTLVPKHFSGFSSFMPMLIYMPIFYWGLLHSREMPYWLVFLIGLPLDAAGGAPLGITPVILVFFLAMLQAQKKYIIKEGFVIKWAYFAALLALTALLHWLLLSLFHAHFYGLGAAVVQWVLAVGLYPIAHRSFDGIARLVQDRRRKILHHRR